MRLLGSVVLVGRGSGARARRHRARRRSRRLLGRRARARDVASANHRRARRSHGAAEPRDRRHRPAHVRRARRRRSGRDSASSRSRSTTPSRRSSRSESIDDVDRLPRVALRQGDDGRRRRRARAGAYLNCPFTREQYEAFIDALIAADQHHGARVRRGAVLRGMHARRGDGAARARDAALRPDEARRAARSAHRPRGVRRRAASHGGSRRPHVEHRRIPDAAAHSGAAARVPDDSRASRTPSSCASDRSTGTRTSIRRRRSRRICRCATIR